jgi:hypothetical protein
MTTIDMEKWLGTMDIEDFNDVSEIYEYFSEENLRSMWPCEDINMEEATLAMMAVLRDFEGE